MALRYKTDVLATLREKGYNTNRLRKERLLSESTIQKLRKQEGVAWTSLETVCNLLDCQPGDLIEHVKQPAYPK